jgi:RNA ligase (TIGR02306 family)
MRKLATLRKIRDLRPIDWADKIELAVIDGWQVIVQKGEFEVGDFCIYCEIDSVMPDKPEFDFLRTKRFRIKTMKMRGTLSQGIAFPISILPPASTMYPGPKEGLDVTELLEVKLWEPAMPITAGASIRGKFPPQVPKTDEERIQNLIDELSKWNEIDFIATEKLDGTSVTYMYLEDSLHVCSRNLDLQPSDKNVHWQIAKKYDLETKLEKHYHSAVPTVQIAIQGEIMGPGIQKNRLKFDSHRFFVFNVFDITKQQFLTPFEMIKIASTFDLEVVPNIAGPMRLNDFTFDELVRSGSGWSALNPEVPREGLVFSSVEQQLKFAQFGRLSFKIVSNDYLLKNE